MISKFLNRMKIANIYWFSITLPIIAFTLLLDSRTSIDNYLTLFISTIFSGGYLSTYLCVMALFVLDLLLKKKNV
jgi:hypothetical protein